MSEESPPEGGAASEAAPAASKRRPLSAKRKLQFALIMVLTPVLLLEGSLRLMGWPTDRIRTIKKLINFDPETFAGAVGVFRPGISSRVSWPPELAYTANINSLGLRGPETTREPALGAFRILCLGDSTTFGFYVEEDETLPQQLQRELRAQGAEQVEVVNGGCGGWTILDQTEFYLERGHQLKPSLVVLTFCSNDLVDLERDRSNYASQKAQLGEEGPGLLKRALYATATYELVLRIKIASKQARLKAKGEVAHPLSSVAVEGERAERLWGLYEQHLTRLRDALRAAKVPLVVVYLPDAWRLQEGLEEVDEGRLSAICQRLELPFASGYPRFKERPVTELYHAPIDAHQNAQGNAVLAEITAKLLRDRKLVPR